MLQRRKIFLLLLGISTVSVLLHCSGQLSWNMDSFSRSCPSLSRPLATHKRTSIAFLKTHKTASTTVQNLLFRFAERNNLTVALPVQPCDHQFCYPHSFSTRFVHPHTAPPDIVTSHMRFNLTELRRLMPNDTVYITILREPAAMFESLFTYYNQYCLSFKRVPNGSLEAFLDDPWSYYRPEEAFSMYARNTLTFDLGGEKDRPETDVAYARRFVAEVERVFSLVMIAEHFDESLVLLRHLLNWDLDDMLYVKLNMRTPTSRRQLSSDLPSKIRAWNSVDAALYDHFNATLWRRLEALGAGCVARELRALRRKQDLLVRGCFGGRFPQQVSATQIKNKELRPWQPSGKVSIVGYELPANASREMCLKLIVPEVQYTRLLLRSQSLRYRRRYLARGAAQTLRTPPVAADRVRVHRELPVTGTVHRQAGSATRRTRGTQPVSQRHTP